MDRPDHPEGLVLRFLSSSHALLLMVFYTDMQIYVKETTVFAVFHPDAHDLYNTCSDLKKIAWELWDPARRLNDEVRATSSFPNRVARCLGMSNDLGDRTKPCSSSARSRRCYASGRRGGSRRA